MSDQADHKVTIYDIANEAGVSPATVSRVINHHEQVSSSTREKIISIMEKYNFSRPFTQKEKSDLAPHINEPSYLFRYNPPLYFDYLDKQSEPTHSHVDIELIYILDGHLNVSLAGGNHILYKNDFLVINSNELHSCHSSHAVLYAQMYIKYFFLCDIIKRENVILSCNSTKENSTRYEELRSLLRKIFNPQISYDHENALQREALYYQFLNQLITRFSVHLSSHTKETEEDTHVAQIDYYIQNHYKEPITLNDLARVLYLSPAYTSTYFKKNFGVNFSIYLSNIRLEHAVQDLKKSEKSITRIAMDNGFPNVNSFNKAFRKKYYVSPSEYIEQLHPEQPSEVPHSSHDVDTRQLALRVFNQDEEFPEITVNINADAERKREYRKFWNKIINVGRSESLYDAEIREHLLLTKRELGFEYVRFWDLYDPVTFLSDSGNSLQYNFTKLDRLFDFLADNDIKPFIELGFKPLVLLNFKEGSHHYMVSTQKTILFKTPHDYERFLYAFVRHYSERYGVENIEQWYFEQWLDPRFINGVDFSEYFDYFSAARRALKSISPMIRLGGGGISVVDSDYTAFILSGKQKDWNPDFFSIYCYPYTDVVRGSVHLSPFEQMNLFKDFLVQTGYYNIDTYITEWNFTVSDRNPLNDGCFKSAYIIQSIFDCFYNVNIMGYWYLSDILSEYIDTRLILYGGNGLITRDGLKKPAYYAFHFLNSLGKYVIYNDKTVIITASERGNYSIICHNFKRPDADYILRSESDNGRLAPVDYYENDNKKHFSFKIKNAKNGYYSAKIRSINDHSGNIWNEWKQMGFPSKLSKQDIDYLKHISIPNIQMSRLNVTDGTLSFDTTLAPQEVQFIHFRFQ